MQQCVAVLVRAVVSVLAVSTQKNSNQNNSLLEPAHRPGMGVLSSRGGLLPENAVSHMLSRDDDEPKDHNVIPVLCELGLQFTHSLASDSSLRAIAKMELEMCGCLSMNNRSCASHAWR